MDWESQDDGYIAKLLVPDGAKDIPVGTPVAVFVEDQVAACPHRTRPYDFKVYVKVEKSQSRWASCTMRVCV